MSADSFKCQLTIIVFEKEPLLTETGTTKSATVEMATGINSNVA